MLRITVVILFLSLFTELLAQTNYAKFVDPHKQGKKQTTGTGDGGSEEIIYLGTVRGINGQVTYHVLSVFRLVQTAIVKHGHSEVVFLDSSLDVIRKYELGLPNELPFLLKDNSLSFHYPEERTNNRRIFKNAISQQLPELLCVSPHACY